ncbi:hypothetical protein QFC21_000710 [Naganishia friedmannii]|uniref:Uncharacterized protein n=1 Tax=Naganishia friedmannii TaxID=89922 RepID=A0ACC2W707_9TREE|nr:hypothetical protein QFC21_000710 [Naganishia friedmannii]
MSDQSTAALLAAFAFERVLSVSTSTPSVYLLGSITGQQAITHLVKTTFDLAPLGTNVDDKDAQDKAKTVAAEAVAFEKVAPLEDNDIYRWAQAWWAVDRSRPDVKITLIYPATDVHVRKYETQKRIMVEETPELYERLVKPYIDGFPASRIQWVYNILNHEKEADRILFEDPDPRTGFLILPDLKWDRKTVSTLYLTAIVFDKSIRSMRDLKKQHLPLLLNIKASSENVVKGNFGLEPSRIRMFVHYQPSYYHFHVHIVALENEGYVGINIGKAHLLSDLISLLSLSSDSDEASLLQKMTLAYTLGEQDGLYRAYKQEAGLLLSIELLCLVHVCGFDLASSPQGRCMTVAWALPLAAVQVVLRQTVKPEIGWFTGFFSGREVKTDVCPAAQYFWKEAARNVSTHRLGAYDFLDVFSVFLFPAVSAYLAAQFPSI